MVVDSKTGDWKNVHLIIILHWIRPNENEKLARKSSIGTIIIINMFVPTFIIIYYS